ncbi:MAG: M15 family metallopeptidase [Clostridia bacterium]|nr:M15 family metallopeptidase [Clostridia bacterium]
MPRRKTKKKGLSAVQVLSAVIAVLVVLLVLVIAAIIDKGSSVDAGDSTSSVVSSDVTSQDVSSQTASQSASSEEQDSSASSVAEAGEWVDNITVGSGYEDWNLILVNTENKLKENYKPATVKITSNGGTYLIDARIVEAYNAMIAAAKEDGVNLTICSGFRYYSTQQKLYNKKVQHYLDKGFSQEAAENTAATIVARPGTSEHQSGLAIDFNPCDDRFDTSKEYKWLSEHAEEFGFVQRYKAEKSSITGITNESWHFRFVGVEHAKIMNDMDYCLEEYIEYLKTK